jgi:diadenosine tetraphosphate (Ap4A) HIT family hydrolase
MSDCIFCAISAERAEASLVYRDADVVAFMDILPVNPGHLLVMPVRMWSGSQTSTVNVLRRCWLWL